MDEKTLLKFKTQCPFPLLKYNVKFTYVKVEKPSGVAYIILELANKRSFEDEGIADLLLSFGIPKDLHHIFGSEIAALIDKDILQSNYSTESFSNPAYFSLIKMKDLRMTQKGKKLFEEGAIPTGEEGRKVAEIYYSPVNRNFLFSDLKYEPLTSSFLGESFLDKVEIDDSGLEDFLKANPTKLGMKEEERLLNFEIDGVEKLQIRESERMEIDISRAGVSFSFPTNNEKNFFDRYYSGALMSQAFEVKDSYKFKDFSNAPISLPDEGLENLLDADRFVLASDIQKAAGEACAIFLSQNRIPLKTYKDALKVSYDLSRQLIDKIDTRAEFVLFRGTSIQYYMPLKVWMNCDSFSDRFALPLLVQKQVDETKKKEIYEDIFAHYKTLSFDEDVGRVISFLNKAYPERNIIKEYADSRVTDCNEDEIDILLDMDRAFSSIAQWKPIFADKAHKIIDNSLTSVRLDNVIFKKGTLEPLRQKLGITNAEFARLFLNAIKSLGDEEVRYEALEDAGFSPDDILPLINIAKIYMGNVLGNEEIAGDNNLSSLYKVIESNMWNLNEMIGVKKYDDYSIKDDFNVDDFFNAYSTLSSMLKKVEKYRRYAPEEYGDMDKYFDIYNPIQEVLSIEKDSSSHPDRISKDYIDKLIARGKYKQVVCDLGVKLQYDLANILGVNETAEKMIDLAYKRGLINRNAQNELHNLRKRRNDFLHPSSRNTQYGLESLEKWRDLVFQLKEEQQ